MFSSFPLRTRIIILYPRKMWCSCSLKHMEHTCRKSCLLGFPTGAKVFLYAKFSFLFFITWDIFKIPSEMIFWEPERPEITTFSIYIILGSYLQWRFLKPSVRLYHSLWWGKFCQQFLSSYGQHGAHGSHSLNIWYSVSLISYWIYRCTWSLLWPVYFHPQKL